MEIKVYFGMLLKRKRKEKRLSQQHLANKSELNRTYISLMERGLKAPSLTTIFKLSSTLEIEASTLIQELERDLEINNVTHLD
ncbi:transcriptional regulator [Priestia megaterium]|nr:transcriptional regulator [Priestia megaterium]